jgi:hypothetical protein
MAGESDAVIDFIVRVWAGLAALLCAGRFVQAALSIIQRKPLPLALWGDQFWLFVPWSLPA